MGLVWRRSLQLRVVVLTLGLSLAVILVLGFVMTSQITDRVLEVKVRAASEEIERAAQTVGGIVGGGREPLAGQQPAAGPQHVDRPQDRADGRRRRV